MAARAIITTAQRHGGPPRYTGPGQVVGTAWTHLEGGGTRLLTTMDLSEGGTHGGIGIGPAGQEALPGVIRKRPTRGVLIADVPYGTVDAMSPPTLWATNTVPVVWPSLSRRGYPFCSTTPRQRPTAPVAGRASGARRPWLPVVDVAVALVLLAAAHASGGHAVLVDKDHAGIAPTHELKQLLHLVGRDPGVFPGPLRYRVAEGDHGAAQAGQQGPRSVTAKLPGVTGNDTRRPLQNTIRGNVVQLVEGGVGDVKVFHGVKRDNMVAQGVAHGGSGWRDRRRRTRG